MNNEFIEQTLKILKSTSALLTCASAKAARTAPATHQVAATTPSATAKATVESAVGSLGSEGARHCWSRAPSSMAVPLTVSWDQLPGLKYGTVVGSAPQAAAKYLADSIFSVPSSIRAWMILSTPSQVDAANVTTSGPALAPTWAWRPRIGGPKPLHLPATVCRRTTY